MKKHHLLFLFALLQACTVGSVDRPESYYQQDTGDKPGELIGSSLFGENNEQIIDLLNYRVTLPKTNRLAILKLSSDNHWRFYSNDFTELNNGIVSGFVNRLRQSNRIYDASFLPAMLVSEKRTVTALREAAARFQADLLLAYRSECRSYRKYRLFNPGETRAYCSIEAVLLDIRSGVIVKSVVSTEDYRAVKSAKDTAFSETVKKAELEAVAKALGNIANEVVAYLNNVPTTGSN